MGPCFGCFFWMTDPCSRVFRLREIAVPRDGEPMANQASQWSDELKGQAELRVG